MNYPIGTVCIGQNFVRIKHRNNMECEIIGALVWRIGENTLTGEIGRHMDYEVRWSDGDVRNVSPHNLRLPPPKHKEWADEKVRKVTERASVHAAFTLAGLIPEEA